MIYLLRHGDAEDGTGDDSSRRLTKKGERQAEAAGKALAQLDAGIDACLTSPKLRAAETAKIACRHLGLDVEIAEQLRGGHFDPGELAAGRGNVLLVGHEPDFSNAVAELTGGRVKLKKGAVAALEGDTLHALLRPSELRAISQI
ncbi:MAG: histidine phosphatase family protein [Actinomycetota bacterium]